MNNLYVILIGGLLAGILLGYLYFRGLWWTVQRMVEHHKPYRLALFSFFIRTLVAVAGFYLLLQFRWEALAVALLGFFSVRLAAVRKWGLEPLQLNKSREESHGV